MSLGLLQIVLLKYVGSSAADACQHLALGPCLAGPCLRLLPF